MEYEIHEGMHQEFPALGSKGGSDNKRTKMRRVKKWVPKKDMLMPIMTIEPLGINACSINGEWEEIELSVDSGATESVVPGSMPSSVPTQPGPASRRGVQYEVANGEIIPNEGDKRFMAWWTKLLNLRCL